MLQYKLSGDQYSVLQGLSYQIANLHYIQERYGDDPELIHVRDTIRSLFDEADGLAIPFWVQNHTIVWSEDWRETKRSYLWQYLESRNVTVA